MYSTDCPTDQKFPIQELTSFVSQTKNVSLTITARMGGTQKEEAWTVPEIASLRELLIDNFLLRSKEAMNGQSVFRILDESPPKVAGEVTGGD